MTREADIKLNEEFLERLEALRKKLGSDNPEDAIGIALQLLEWAVVLVHQGTDVHALLVHPDKSVDVVRIIDFEPASSKVRIIFEA
jgi:hypothetical protein